MNSKKLLTALVAGMVVASVASPIASADHHKKGPKKHKNGCKGKNGCHGKKEHKGAEGHDDAAAEHGDEKHE